MSEIRVYQCDGPACVATADALDEDELIPLGWLLVTYEVEDEEKMAHLHSLGCLEVWASICAREEAEAA